MLCIVVLYGAKHKGIANRCTIQPIVVLLWFVCVVSYCYNTTTIRPQYKQSIFIVCCLCVSYNTTTTQNKNTIFQRTIHLSPPQAAVLVWHTNTQRFCVSQRGHSQTTKILLFVCRFCRFIVAVISQRGPVTAKYMYKNFFLCCGWYIPTNHSGLCVLCTQYFFVIL